ncbi:hypothetical protein DdX_16744 [Ditylenchus destructor]|uniref:C2H2-type domain-containing protein n=1 Tax=Ditylenchus destructor TaxID=166010 RepID=A0AAD4MT31_9BILA|nr:hypothetical protein DdX_16744 [Ditylenchus destructor]
MHPRFVCSKCGQCDFQAIDDLETHIVEKHYSDVNVLYRCLDPKCPSRFPTESVMLHHMRDKHMGFMSESREGNIVSLRLAIHDTLNDSINISFSTLTNLNGNTFVAPTTSQAAPSPKPNFEHLLSPSGDPNMSVAKSQSFDSPKVDIFKDEPSWVKNLAIASSQGELAAANPDGPSISSYTSQYSFDLEKMGEYSQESVRSTDHNGSTNSGHEQQMPTHSNDGQHIVRQAYKVGD